MRIVSARFESAALGALFAFWRRAPWPLALASARLFGDLLFDVVRIRRRVTLANLRAAFPEKGEPEIGRIARDCYRCFATTAMEFAKLPFLSDEDVRARVEIPPGEAFDRILRSDRGAILLTGHFGNWELAAAVFPVLGRRVHVLAGEQHNPYVTRRMDAIRESRGLSVLSVEKDLRGIAAALRGGSLLAIVADQDAGRDGIFVPFLGREASTAVGPIRLAQRYGVPVLFAVARHLPGGRVRLEWAEPFTVPKEGDAEAIVAERTRLWSGMLEEQVRRYPEQWFWMHRRWKTRPEAARARKEATG
ncbi:MAG: lysophospholipid acyltransferase family protein [Candidatus Eisenbacteria bacterium]|nr:lysophospholipid acyltransferase family protein [Candidatus Eisenbacteria bacterium]